MVPDIGPVGARKLLTVFGKPKNIFDAGFDALTAVEGIGLQRAINIKAFSSWKEVEEKIQVMGKRGIKAVLIGEPSYPEMLKEIGDAPVILYTKGEIQPQDRFAIAIVGVPQINTLWGVGCGRHFRKPCLYGVYRCERYGKRR